MDLFEKTKNLGGFGELRKQALKEHFENEEAFENALSNAYWNCDIEDLEAVDKISTGYAKKLARWYGTEKGLSGGNAEPVYYNI
jgi:hypothetical protein